MARAAGQDRTRLSAADWEEAALDMIGQKGVPALAVEPLARRLEVTKGSFYWHFASRDALLSAALARWERDDQALFSAALARHKQPRSKMLHMFRLTLKQTRSHRLFASLFAAADDPLVRPVVQRVTDARIGLLESGLREAGMAAEQAQHRARLTFFSYLGFLQYYRRFRSARLPRPSLENYLQHVTETLVP